jgi:hypothetical protein
MKKYSIIGFVGIAVYALTIIIGEAIRPEFTFFSGTISWIFAKGLPHSQTIALFLTLANILIIIMAAYGYSSVKNKMLKTAMALLIASSLIATILFNFYPMDPWAGVRTAADILHDSIFAVVVFLIWGSMLMMYLGARADKKWDKLSNYFLICFVLLVVLSLSAGYFWQYLYSLTGLFETLFLIVFLQWLGVVAYRLEK